MASLFSINGQPYQSGSVLTADQYNALTPAQKNAYDQQFMSPSQIAKVNSILQAQTPAGQTFTSPYASTPAQTAQVGAPTTPDPSLQGNAQAFAQAWLASGGKTSQDLANFIQQHPEYGATLAKPGSDKVTIGGQMFDAVNGSDGPNPYGQWLPVSAGGNGTGGGANNPLSQPFSYPAFTGTFSYPGFQAPTLDQAQQMPGFQFGLQNGEDALTRSRAAIGSALNTGTLKDLQKYAQDYSNQAYNTLYGQDLNTYATNRENALGNYQQQYQQYLNGLNAAMQGYGLNAGTQNQLFNQAFDQSQAQFQNQLSLANLGLQGTLAGVNAGANYANQAGNLATGAGNAAAAGTVGAGNAYNNGFGNLANFYNQAQLYSQSPYNPGNQLAGNPYLFAGGIA